MSTTIDRKVVEMRFDNKDFETKVKGTMSTLENLKEKLKFTGASKGLENITNLASKFNLTGMTGAIESVRSKFSALEVMGLTALANITNSAVNAGIRISKALTIDPITTGFSEYETKINAIQTIMSNTSSKGTTMADVTKTLNELNLYADKTIYNFAEMTRNIGTFTAAGVGLEDSAKAIQGIANLAAASGSTSQQASTAMYQLSQALASGTVKLMDWNSVVNAGMGGQLFQEALKTTAREHGIKVDQIIKKNGSFRESLQEGWITADILNETLSKFTVDGATKYAKAMMESGKWTQAQADALIKEAQSMEDAATKVKTFTQLWSTLQEAAQSGWAQSWEIIVGNFDEAKLLLTEISDTIGEVLNNSANARNKVLQEWKDLGGRTALVEALRNVFQGIASIMEPINKAFREIFPPITAQQLLNFSNGLKDLTSKLKLSEGAAKTLYSIFKGGFAVIDIGITIVKEFVSGIFKLVNSFTGLAGGVMVTTASLGDWLSMVRDSIKESDIFGKTIGKAFEFLSNGVTNTLKFITPGLKGLFNLLIGIRDFIWKIGLSIGKVLGESLREGDLLSIVNIFNSGVIGSILLGVNKFVKGFSSSFENISDILDSFKGILESYQQDLQAKTLMKIATAIGILAASLFVLSIIKPENLSAGVTAMTVLFTELLGALFVFGKIAGNVKSVFKASIALLTLSSAMLGLSIALRIMSTMDWKGMGVGLISMTVALGELIGVMWALPKDNSGKTTGMIKLAFSLVILGGALKILATMSWVDFGKSIAIMASALGLFIGLTWALHATNMKDNTKGMTKIAFSLVVLGGALKILATMTWDDIFRSLTVMSIALGEFIGLTWALHATNMKDNTKGMTKLAFSLIILGGALKLLATMSWTEIGRSLAAMTGALALLIGLTWALHAASSSGKTAVAMLGLTSSLILLATALKVLGSMGEVAILKSLISLAVVFGLIWAAGKLLAPLTPVLLSIAGACALFALAALGFGVGLGLIAAGISALALALSTGVTAILAGLGAIILGVAGLIPELIEIFGDAIAVLCKVIIECTPLIADTILVVFAKIFQSLAQNGPTIVNSLFQFLISILNSLRDYLPDLIVAGVEVIGAFFEGIVNALKGIDPSSLLQGVAGLTLLTALVYMLSGIAALIPGAMLGVIGLSLVIAELGLMLAAFGGIAQIPGVSWIIEQGGNLLQSIGTAIGQFIGGLLGGIALGATSTLPQVGTNLSGFMTNLLPFIEGVKTIDASILGKIAILAGAMTLITGANLVAGIASFLSGGASLSQLGTELSNFMTNVSGFILGASMINPAMMDGVKALAETVLILTAADILQGLTSWLTGGSSLAEFGSQLGGLGTNLNEFATNLGTFTESQVNTVTCACNAIKSLAEAAHEIPNEGGLWASIVGENSLATFGGYLPGLATNLNAFVNNLGTFTDEQVTTVDCAARAIKALAESAKEIPNDGGLWGAIVGENSLASFGNYLPGVGTNLGEFVTNLGTFTDGQVTTVECAGRAIKALAESAKEIPNTGGLWASIVGDNSLAAFGDKLPGLGTNLSGFIANLGTFTDGQVTTVDCAARAIKGLAEAAKTIPNEGGMWAAIVGENSLATFGEKLPGLATHIAGFVNNLGTFNDGQVATIDSACEAIRSIATLGNIDINSTGSGLESFGNNMAKFSKKVKTFVEQLGEVGSDSITSAINKTKELIEMAKNMADINVESIKTFGESLKETAKNGVKGFVEEFSGDSPKEEAKKAATAMLDALIQGADSKMTDVESKFKKIAEAAVKALCTNALISDAKQAGKDLVTGFANGIKNNKSLASSAGSEIGKAALNAAKEAIDSNSPSKEAEYLGNFFGQGFVIGIKDYAGKVYDTSYSVADSAKAGLSKAIAKISEMVNSDIDAQPTIRPVLDLSDVESGVGHLSGMFNRGPSLAVATNLGAISYGMGSRIQNGQNNDVISAINKLGKSLGNVGGDTYNINGVSYDGESGLADAVKTIIRAAKVERRS